MKLQVESGFLAHTYLRVTGEVRSTRVGPGQRTPRRGEGGGGRAASRGPGPEHRFHKPTLATTNSLIFNRIVRPPGAQGNRRVTKAESNRLGRRAAGPAAERLQAAAERLGRKTILHSNNSQKRKFFTSFD